MYEQKTKENDKSVIEYIESVESPKKREDAYKLLAIFTEVSGYQAKMWGPSIIGFSLRKAKISLYFATGDTEREKLLEKFGKHTSGKACVYINKLVDIDTKVLEELISQSINFLRRTYPE